MGTIGVFPSNNIVQQYIMAANQADSDKRYVEKTIPEYKTQVDNWIQLNSHSRELSSNPNAYIPTPPPAKPQKTVWFLEGNGVNSKLVDDPSIPDTILPPYVGNQSKSIVSTTNIPVDPKDVMLVMIHQDLQLIKAKLGIT